MRTGRQTRYALAHDLDSWKTDERIATRGFARRWDSVVADGNGEDFFFQLLQEHLSADLDVLDVDSLPFDEVASWVTGPLAGQGIAGCRLWWIDAPEYLYTARSLYDRLTDYDRQLGDALPPWDSVAAEVQAAFDDNQSDGAVALRHIRLVWTVRLP